MNEGYVRNYAAGADVAANHIVKFSADNTVVKASANTDVLCGVSSSVDAVNGGRCDVVRLGPAKVVLGGTLARGAPFTSDANGAAVALSTVNALGISQMQLGTIEISGVAGDIVPCIVGPAVIA